MFVQLTGAQGSRIFNCILKVFSRLKKSVRLPPKTYWRKKGLMCLSSSVNAFINGDVLVYFKDMYQLSLTNISLSSVFQGCGRGQRWRSDDLCRPDETQPHVCRGRQDNWKRCGWDAPWTGSGSGWQGQDGGLCPVTCQRNQPLWKPIHHQL